MEIIYILETQKMEDFLWFEDVKKFTENLKKFLKRGVLSDVICEVKKDICNLTFKIKVTED